MCLRNGQAHQSFLSFIPLGGKCSLDRLLDSGNIQRFGKVFVHACLFALQRPVQRLYSFYLPPLDHLLLSKQHHSVNGGILQIIVFFVHIHIDRKAVELYMIL